MMGCVRHGDSDESNGIFKHSYMRGHNFVSRRMEITSLLLSGGKFP